MTLQKIHKLSLPLSSRVSFCELFTATSPPVFLGLAGFQKQKTHRVIDVTVGKILYSQLYTCCFSTCTADLPSYHPLLDIYHSTKRWPTERLTV